MKLDIAKAEAMLGYTFKDKALLKQSLTHSSYAFEKKLNSLQSNERLEFLGDAVLQIVMSTHLYGAYPRMDEGDLTRLRAKVVCEDSLAFAARKVGMGPHIQLGRGEEKSGGHTRDSILADTYEAILGGIYLDGQMPPAKDFIHRTLVPYIEQISKSIMVSDYKTTLQEAIQKHSTHPLSYETIHEDGPAHNKTFHVEVRHQGQVLGKGVGKSKKDAEQQAARKALEKR